MNLIIHVEVEGTEQPLVCENKTPEETLAFITSISAQAPSRVQCNFTNEVNGEARALARITKTPEDSASLLADAAAWIDENK